MFNQLQFIVVLINSPHLQRCNFKYKYEGTCFDAEFEFQTYTQLIVLSIDWRSHTEGKPYFKL